MDHFHLYVAINVLENYLLPVNLELWCKGEEAESKKKATLTTTASQRSVGYPLKKSLKSQNCLQCLLPLILSKGEENYIQKRGRFLNAGSATAISPELVP